MRKMSEYIDKDALIETLKDAHKRLIETIGYTRHTIGFEGAMDYVEEAPTADVVEVVRCKDCKWWDGIECQTRDIDVVDVDDFCSYGERKGGE